MAAKLNRQKGPISQILSHNIILVRLVKNQAPPTSDCVEILSEMFISYKLFALNGILLVF